MIKHLIFLLIFPALLISMECSSYSASEPLNSDGTIFFSKDVVYGQVVGDIVNIQSQIPWCPNYSFTLKVYSSLKNNIKKDSLIQVQAAAGGFNIVQGAWHLIALDVEKIDPECKSDGVGKYYIEGKTTYAAWAPFSVISLKGNRFLVEQCMSDAPILFSDELTILGAKRSKVSIHGISCNRLEGSIRILLKTLQKSLKHYKHAEYPINLDFFKAVTNRRDK